jgi:agmatine/peptidylarginine deiminase
MTIESVIGIISGILAIAGALIWVNDKLKKLSLAKLMDKLIDTKYSSKRHRRVLKIMNLKLGKCMIKKDYIDNFILNDRKKEEVFKDICEQNNIEPTETICTKFMGYDMKMFRKEYNSKRRQTNIPDATICTEEKQSAYILSLDNDGQTVYMSGLLMDRHPETCKKLISILEKHNVNYSFIQGTKDIWCRDYMPVQTQSGKFIQFKYDPSYLKGKKEWEDSRSDKKEILEKNDWMQKLNIKESDINLDGGNVLICDGRAILSDRIFTENPKCDKESLKKELSELLECKDIIIIPALKSQYEDFTGHADGMVRFVDRNTIIGNERRPDEYQYMKDGLQKAIDTFNLTYIDVPYFEDKDPNHPDSAIGIYVNYLEVNNLIVLPVFGREEDDQVRDIFRKTFPNKQIETIDYNEVAKEGGLLNCTTWVVKCK